MENQENIDANLSPKAKLEYEIANTYGALKRLPNGPDVEISQKRELHAQLVSMVNANEFLSDEEKRRALDRIHQALAYSLMTKEEAIAAGEKTYVVSSI